MSDILWKSALELRDMIGKKQISPTEVLDQTLQRLNEVEPQINAFLEVTEDQARQGAKAAEKALMNGGNVGELCGIPVSVKDLIAVKDARLTFGSRAMKDNVAGVDAPSVERVRKAGGVILGKTTTSEFGCKGVGDSPLTGITRNPWNLERTPGGSSCGAAASVAAGVTALSFGTDGGGSVRLPSSFAGLFGIKGHFGRIPVFPTSATPTLAHVGPLCRTVRDAALLLKVASGYDARDPGAVAQPVPDFLAACDQSPRGLRVAWSPTLGYARPDKEVVEVVEAGVKVLEDIGCEVKLVEKVMEKDPVNLFMAEFFAGAGTRLRPVLEKSRDLLDPVVADTLQKALAQEMGEYYTTVFERYDLRTKLYNFFIEQEVDVIVSPTLPVPAFAAGQEVPPGFKGDSHLGWIYYTYPFNLTGLPACSIPVGFSHDGMPIGMQVVGRHLEEETIFKIAAAFEEAQPWADKRPNI